MTEVCDSVLRAEVAQFNYDDPNGLVLPEEDSLVPVTEHIAGKMGRQAGVAFYDYDDPDASSSVSWPDYTEL